LGKIAKLRSRFLEQDQFNRKETQSQSPFRATGAAWDFPFLFLILLLTILAFLPSLFGEFVFDEHNLVIENRRLGSLAQIPSSFFRLEEETAVVSHDIGTVGRYRPLPASMGVIAFRLFKLNPVWWHVLNLALYLLTVTAIYSIFRHLSPDPWVYRPATLFFALHPVHTEVVGWVANFGNTLFGLGFAMALWFHIESRRTATRGLAVLSFAFFQVALFSREGALTFPLAIFAYEWFFAEGNLSSRIITSLRGIIPSLLGVAFYLCVRYFALGGALRMASQSTVPWNTVFFSIPQALVNYISLLFFPYKLSLVYPFSWVGALDQPGFWGSLLVVFALGYLLRKFSERRLEDRGSVGFALAFMAAGILPYLHLRALSPELLLQDRYLYISSMGFSLLLALLALSAATRLLRFKGASVILIVLIAGLFGWTSFQQSFVWANDVTLFSRALEVSPRSSLANQNMGMAYLQINRLDDARRCFEAGIGLGNAAAGNAGLGDVAFAQGNFQAAVGAYEQSLASNWSFSANLLRNLGLAYYQIGDDDQALRSFELLSSHFPEISEGFLHSGVLLLKRKEFLPAIDRLRQAGAIDPGNYDIPYFIGEAFEGMGNRAEAIKAYQAALSLAPGFKKAQSRLNTLESPAK